MPSLTLTDAQKVLLRQSWQIIYAKMGKDLSYVGSSDPLGGGGGGGAVSAVDDGQTGAADGGVAATFLKLFQVKKIVSA